ncbi:MAG TPA: chemotaxis protein CheW, partial [Planctomycetota bacterium]|nr:chemotaxis protein CheW [Planctomycetota bacterium]
MLRGADGIPDEVLIFQLDDRRFGVPLAAVREVLPSLASEPLPGAPGAIEGVIDVRGEVVPVVDVRARLGLGARAISIADHIVVARAGDRTVGLRADRALGLARVPAGAFAGAEGITALEAPVAGVARL